MILRAKERTSYTFGVMMPLFTPYYNEWGKNVYWHDSAFRHNPFTIDASSTSGSPVVVAGNKFFGFLNKNGGEFAFDGFTTLTVTLEAGQELYCNECCDPWSEFSEYNRAVIGCGNHTDVKFWSKLEYCTWVEQTKTAMLSGSTNYNVLNEDFVYGYMKKAASLGLPKQGKFTIDDGWAINHNAAGQYYTGDWEIDRTKFPHFEKLINDIQEEGYIPGLWFSPFNISPDCAFAKAHPEAVGARALMNNRNYIRYTPELEPELKKYFRSIFEPYIQMGIHKLKLDISYGRKDEMIELLRLMYSEIKKLDRTVEVESHIPDIFASPFTDTVRLNDVSIYPNENWRTVIAGHFLVCRYSSDRILNLDHLGGNNPQCYASMFSEHVDMLYEYSKYKTSYPVISMLPDIYSKDVQERFAARVREF